MKSLDWRQNGEKIKKHRVYVIVNEPKRETHTQTCSYIWNPNTTSIIYHRDVKERMFSLSNFDDFSNVF